LAGLIRFIIYLNIKYEEQSLNNDLIDRVDQQYPSPQKETQENPPFYQ